MLHLLENETIPKGPGVKERIPLGSKESGIILDISKEGININGYYTFNNVRYINLRKSMSITWDGLELLKENASKTGRKTKKIDTGKEVPITVEDLNELPKVTMNGSKYFIDVINKQIRPEDRPQIAYPLTTL